MADVRRMALLVALLVLLVQAQAPIDMVVPHPSAGVHTEFPRESWDESWQSNGPEPSPPPRDVHASAYDSQSDRLVIFGGDVGQIVVDNDTWTYDLNTNTWMETTPLVSPPALFGPVMTYDEESDRIVLYGGTLNPGGGSGMSSNETWVYDLEENTWTNMNPSLAPPAGGRPMAYDTESDRIVLLVSGGASSQTWTYDFNQNTWTDLTSGLEPTMSGGPMAYDAESDRVLVFGTARNCAWPAPCQSLTWTYDLNSNLWENRTAGVMPSPRRARMAYDAESDRVVLFGGIWRGVRNDETWSYDYNSNIWSEISVGVRPRPRSLHTMVYDSESDRVLFFGGQTSQPFGGSQLTINNDTWAYDHNTEAWTPMTKPGLPRNLVARSVEGGVDLVWDPPSWDGGTPVTNYRIYRNTTSDSISLLAEIGSVASYRDENLSAQARYEYRVSAVTLAGEGPPYGVVIDYFPPPPLDTTLPDVEISSPADGAVLEKLTVEVRGTATDDVAVETVEVRTGVTAWVDAPLDGIRWVQTVEMLEGLNTIYARATDSSGNVAETSVTVTAPSVPSPPWLIIGTSLAASLGAVGALVYFLRRRGRRTP